MAEVRQWMAGRRLDVAYITRPTSIAYLSGFHADPHERLMALAVRAGDATLIVPSLEEEKAQAHAHDATVVAWRDGEDPYELVARAIGAAAEVGVEKDHLTLHAAELLTSRTGASDLVDLASEIRRLRLIKNAAEIDALARAAAITDEAFVKVLARMHAGLTEIDVALMFGSMIGELGGTPSFPTSVQAGANSAMPHHEPSSRKLARGDFVLIDFGAAVDGYKADSTRMAVIGEPSARQREIHNVVLRAHDAGIAAVRPGATTGDVDAAARGVIEVAGYGKEFFHRVGHGLGLEIHEDPSLDPESTTVLAPGMVFTVEPGVYIPGFGGVRIEDDVVVEGSGVRVLTRADRSLHVIPG
jgi:Xaa-Pro dipeptidase